MKKNAKVDALDKDQHTALYVAIANGRTQVVKLLLHKGTSTSMQNGMSALLLAARKGNIEIMKLLLSYGAKLTEEDVDGYTSIHHAALGDSYEMIQFLAKKGIKLEKKTKAGDTALHLATKNGKLKAIEALLRQGADLASKDIDSRTPLHLAVYHNKLAAANELLVHGANIEARDKYKNTPLHTAVNQVLHSSDFFKDWEKGIQFLLTKGAKINAVDDEGKTILHKYFHYVLAEPETAELMLRSGADLYVKDKQGNTPLGIAKEMRQKRILEVIKKYLASQK